MNRRTTKKIVDIRIVSQEHLQPTLFNGPIVTTQYILVDWETEERINDELFDTLPKAEKRAYELALPSLLQALKEQ